MGKKKSLKAKNNNNKKKILNFLIKESKIWVIRRETKEDEIRMICLQWHKDSYNTDSKYYLKPPYSALALGSHLTI